MRMRIDGDMASGTTVRGHLFRIESGNGLSLLNAEPGLSVPSVLREAENCPHNVWTLSSVSSTTDEGNLVLITAHSK
jgi:hypothetical protein